MKCKKCGKDCGRVVFDMGDGITCMACTLTPKQLAQVLSGNEPKPRRKKRWKL